MSEALARSTALLKFAIDVIRRDRPILRYPMFALLSAIGIVFVFVHVERWLDPESIAGRFLLHLVANVAITFAAAFFHAALVQAMRTRFEGSPCDFAQAIAVAKARAPYLGHWALLTTGVVVLLHPFPGPESSWFIAMVHPLPQITWWAATLFVVPVIVYKDLAPIPALRDSLQTFAKAWAETIMATFAIRLATTALVLLGVLLTEFLLHLVEPGTPAFGLIVVAFFTYLFVVISLSAAVHQIWTAAVYHWVSTGKRPPGCKATGFLVKDQA